MIALDLGSSSIKGAVIEPETMRIRHVHRVPFPNALPNLAPLHSEVDPGEILSTVRGLIAALIPHVELLHLAVPVIRRHRPQGKQRRPLLQIGRIAYDWKAL